jgi:hypothetical protein
MSILKDRIRPLDPSSLQEFLAPDREAEAGRVNPGTSSEKELLRVPVRDITSAHETATSGPLDSGSDRAVLDTGQ